MAIKISSLSAGLDANLTDAAVLPVTDSTTTTVKATLAQVAKRARLNVGAPSAKDYGAVADGSADDTTALANANAALGAAGVLVLSPGTYRVASNLSLACAITVMPGAVLAPATGVTITIAKVATAPRTQWISTATTGRVAFGHGAIDVAYPEWWGAVPSVSSFDCYPAFLAMQTACKGNGETGEVDSVFPTYTSEGYWYLSKPIPLYSGNHFRTAGISTIFIAKAAFTGDRLFDLVAKAGVNYCSAMVVGDLTCDQGPNTGLAAMKPTAGVVENNEFGNIHCFTSYGLILNTYAQFNVIRRLLSQGPIDQLIYIAGQMNHIYDLDKEGGTGTTAEPYVNIVGSGGNKIDNILLEGVGSVNKCPIVLSGCDTTEISNYWMELNAHNGFILDIEHCTSTKLQSLAAGLSTTSKIKVRNSSMVMLGALSSKTNDAPLDSMLDIDTYSTILVEGHQSLNGAGGMPLDKPNIRIGAMGMQNLAIFANTDVSAAVATASRFGGNLLTNPSFEAGNYGWVFSTAPDLVETYIASEVGPGLMAHWRWSTGTDKFVNAGSITVPAAWVGRPVSIAMLGKVTDSAGSPTAVMYPLGQGTGWGGFKLGAAQANTGWRVMQQTVYPKAAGVLQVGVICSGSSATADFYLDEVCAVLGAEAMMNPARFGTLEIGGRTFMESTAAPTTGTWRVGDRVFNNAPAVGSPKSWVCTVAGSPGTWVSEGNL